MPKAIAFSPAEQQLLVLLSLIAGKLGITNVDVAFAQQDLLRAMEKAKIQEEAANN